MQKTVVFFSIDGFGHIHPMLAIASQIQQRGHNAVILTVRQIPWASRVTSLGLKVDYCLNESLEENDNDFVKLFDLMVNPDPTESMRRFYAEDGFVCSYMLDIRKNRDLICDKLASLRPDLVVVDSFLSSCCYPKIACPWVGLYPACPLRIYSSYSENCVAELGLKLGEMTPEMKALEVKYTKPTLNVMRTFWLDHGITTWPGNLDVVPVSPHLNFYLGPRELGYENVAKFGGPLPETWFRLEHTIDTDSPQTGEFELPEKLRNLPGKVVYFSLGTIVGGNPGLINRLLAMLAKSPNKFIVSMGPNYEQVKLAHNMWGDKFLDQKAILSKSDMFITHGGHNSTIEAFYYGVPALIVMPGFSDQFDIAQRIQDCGLGVRMNPFTCGEDELLSTIEAQLANEQVEQRIKSIGSRLRSINYPRIAADKLDELLAGAKTNGFDAGGNNNNGTE